MAEYLKCMLCGEEVAHLYKIISAKPETVKEEFRNADGICDDCLAIQFIFASLREQDIPLKKLIATLDKVHAFEYEGIKVTVEEVKDDGDEEGR